MYQTAAVVKRLAVQTRTWDMHRFLLLIAVGVSATAGAQNVIQYPAVPAAKVVELKSPSFKLPQDDCELNGVSGIVIQKSGIVVANGGNTELCFFDVSGRFLKKAGRRGGGPGEFVRIDGIHSYLGDSILVVDAMQKRVTFFSPRGDRAREFATSAPDTGLGFHSTTIPLAGGTLLLGFSEFRTGAPRPEAVMFSERLFRFDSRGGSPQKVGSFPMDEHFIQTVPAEMGGTAYWSLAFGRTFTTAPLAKGFIGGDGTDDAVRQYDAAGKLQVVHQLGLARQPVTDEAIAAYKTESLKGTRPERRALEQKLIDEMPFPKQFPAYSHVLSEDDARIWVQPYPVGGTHYWIRATPATMKVQGFSFPPRFRLLAVGGGKACGVGRDDVDLETVYCFALPR